MLVLSHQYSSVCVCVCVFMRPSPFTCYIRAELGPLRQSQYQLKGDLIRHLERVHDSEECVATALISIVVSKVEKHFKNMSKGRRRGQNTVCILLAI